jgi:ribosomal protein L32
MATFNTNRSALCTSCGDYRNEFVWREGKLICSDCDRPKVDWLELVLEVAGSLQICVSCGKKRKHFQGEVCLKCGVQPVAEVI